MTEEKVPLNYKLLITEEQIKKRVSEIGKEITQKHSSSRPILIGVLNGSFLFLADLIRKIPVDLEIDFIRISSYGDGRESTGHVKILKPLSADINGRSVVVVEDIVDSGLSIKFLRKMLTAFQPKTLEFVTLLHKYENTIEEVHVDYTGFKIEDKFVVGYGLDDQQFKRNLKQIYVIE